VQEGLTSNKDEEQDAHEISAFSLSRELELYTVRNQCSLQPPHQLPIMSMLERFRMKRAGKKAAVPLDQTALASLKEVQQEFTVIFHIVG